MDAEERLSLEAVNAPTLMSAQHLHRYALAARLCRGLRVLDLACGVGYGSELLLRGGARSVVGVDIAEAAVAQARRAFDGRPELRFEQADALEHLRRIGAEDVDAIVAFEALEHLPALPETLDRLAELAAAGVRLLLSVPNSRAFGEVNAFHLTDFGYDETRAAFDRFGGTYLYQHIAEGSVILPEGEAAGFEGAVGALDQGEPEYANTFLVAVGFPDGEPERAGAQLNLVATPNHNRYMLELAASNEELWRTNQRLAQSRLGKSDAAAASAQSRIDALRAELERRDARIEELTIVAKRNDDLYQQQVAWHDAARYRAADRVVEAIRRVPGLAPAMRLLGRGRGG
jgi:SAM-dependent methyltransferase